MTGLEEIDEDVVAFDDPTPEVDPADPSLDSQVLRGFCGVCRRPLQLEYDYGPRDSDSLQGLIATCASCARRDRIDSQWVDGDLLYSFDAFISFSMGKRWTCWTDDGVGHAVVAWWDQVPRTGERVMHVLIACHGFVIPVEDDFVFIRLKNQMTVGRAAVVTCIDCLAGGRYG